MSGDCGLWCPFKDKPCRGAECVAAVPDAREWSDGKTSWYCGFVLAACEEGGRVIDVTREG